MIKTYNDIYIYVYKKLCAVDRDSAHFEAREIVCAVYRKKKEDWYRFSSMYCGRFNQEQLDEIIGKRLRHMPLAYILSEWDFYGRTFTVTPDVLIPRPETEVLTQKALERVKAYYGKPNVLDLCCGSGCIGITVALEDPGCKVYAADISQKALEVCSRNIERYDLAERVEVLMANAQKAPPEELPSFDIIICNPPYVTTEEMKRLDKSVRDYEPTLALDGGADGMNFYRSIVEKWAPILHTTGWLYFEVGYTQGESVAQILREAGFGAVEIFQDLSGVHRVVCGKAPETFSIRDYSPLPEPDFKWDYLQ